MAIDSAGNTLKTATNVTFEGKTVFKEQIGNRDKNDFLRFKINSRSEAKFSLSNLNANADLQLLDRSGRVISASERQGKSSELINKTLGSGTYYIRVHADSTINTSYTLSTLFDSSGNTSSTSRLVSIGSISNIYRDWVGSTDTRDYYQFNLATPRVVSLSLSNLEKSASFRLLNSNGNIIQTSADTGTIERSLQSGTYYVQVASNGRSTNYSLNLSATQSPSVDTSLYWTKQLGTNQDDNIDDIVTDNFGNVYVAGSTYGSLGGFNAGLEDIWLAKYNSSGDRLWIQQYGRPGYDRPSSIAVDISGNVYLAGTTLNSEGDGIWFTKYNSSGVRQWTQDIASDGYSNYINDVTVDSDGKIYVTGATLFSLGGANQGTYDAWLAQYDSNGINQWTRQLGSSESEFSRSVTLDPSGNIYIAGNTNGSLGSSYQGNSDAWIAKYSNLGNLQWVRQFGTSSFDATFSIQAKNEGIYLAGRTEGNLGSSSAGDSDSWTAKYDPNGNQLWMQQQGTSNYDIASSIDLDIYGNLYVVTSSRSSTGELKDSRVLKYTSFGNYLGAQQLGTAGDTYSWSIDIDINGDMYAAGGTTGSVGANNAGLSDAWLAKYKVNSSGNTFNSTYGYGLVNAAAAVARAVGQFTFADVANLGGVNWGNDLINAPEVWAKGFTGQGVTVAVIDTGVDITHSDLASNIWRNTREVFGNGIDDDGNGYVDDVNGWNFGANNSNPANGSTSVSGNGHGTHVAGTIAGINNGFGVTGVAYNSKIMPIKLGDTRVGEDGKTYFNRPGSLAAAIRYAVDNGARVINMSVGWSDSPELASAMAYAASRNVITISSAGNAAALSPGVPAYYATQYGISVGAVDRSRTIANFSNRAGLDSNMNHIVGPGVDVYSTLPGDKYASLQGTSMAAPHVAGVVALMLSANPNLTSDQVRQILINSSIGLNFSTQTASGSELLVDLFV